MLAGIPVTRELVLELAAGVDDPARTTLLEALDAGRAAIALTVDEREQILGALCRGCDDGLAELRGVLFREREWRAEHGLG
jgi:hypothetical protein